MFFAGDVLEVHGVAVRFIQGRKGPGDVRLELRATDWTAASMKLGFLMADFYAQNEAVLYPHLGELAGDRFLSFCAIARAQGWAAAAERLDNERAAAARRRNGRP